MRTTEVVAASQGANESLQTTENQNVRDERWLVAQAQAGSQDAIGQLYQRHWHKVYRTVLRILRNQEDAEDAVQRAFQRVLTNLKNFRQDSSFLTWLTRIAINEALLVLRERRTREHIDRSRRDADEKPLEISDGRPSPEQMLCESECRARLHQAIDQLREKLRVVVKHRELQGLTSAETARRLGLTVNVVKSRTFNARKLLKKRLQRNFIKLNRNPATKLG